MYKCLECEEQMKNIDEFKKHYIKFHIDELKNIAHYINCTI